MAGRATASWVVRACLGLGLVAMARARGKQHATVDDIGDRARAYARKAVARMTCDNSTHYGWHEPNKPGDKPRATNSGMWRNALPAVFAALARNGPEADPTIHNGHVYEFGVFRGGSLRLLRSMSQFEHSFLWGFDSFEGLPTQKSKIHNWATGKYKADPREKLLADLGGPNAIGFVKGFYNESLADGEILSNRLGMKPAKYVDIDADLYSSTLEALRFLFRSKLIRPGTIIGYDDFMSFTCDVKASKEVHTGIEDGEARAHAEIAAEFGVRYLCLAGSCLPPSAGLGCQSANPIFLVESIAHPEGGDSGFHLTPEELVAWKRSDPSCQGNLRPDRPLGQRAQQVRRRFQQPGYNPIGMAG